MEDCAALACAIAVLSLTGDLQHAQIAQVPASLGEALDALEADHEFLTQGDVFTPDLIQTWIDYKRTNEIDPIRLRPHPHEFAMYYDI